MFNLEVMAKRTGLSIITMGSLDIVHYPQSCAPDFA